MAEVILGCFGYTRNVVGTLIVSCWQLKALLIPTIVRSSYHWELRDVSLVRCWDCLEDGPLQVTHFGVFRVSYEAVCCESERP